MVSTDEIALPEVHAVITGADLSTKRVVIPWTPDETALAMDKVRLVGDVVAAVNQGPIATPPAREASRASTSS